MKKGPVLALSGGVGGARLCAGLAAALPPGQLLIAVNTADDFEHLGLPICPDLDTVMYTLAALEHPRRGWGLAADSDRFMAALRRLGGADWFELGDQDLATHVLRGAALAAGEPLSAITGRLCRRLGIASQILPMSDDTVRTRVHTAGGVLSFQQYFVREACAPEVSALDYQGADAAVPHPAWFAPLRDGGVSAVVLCPSNPLLSLDPILALPGVRAALRQSRAPVVAVSPIIAGRAVKGPAAELMAQLGLGAGAAAVARHYGELLDGFVIDRGDSAEIAALAGEGAPQLLRTEILMRTPAIRRQLGAAVLDFASALDCGNG